MKTAGLSSKVKKQQRHTTKMGVLATVQENQLRARERQRILRVQAEQAQMDRQKRETQAAKDASPAPQSTVNE